MSYDNDFDFYTDTTDYSLHELLNNDKPYKSKVNIINLIADLNDNTQILNKVVKQIFNNYLDKAIKDYAYTESLPVEFVNLAKLDNGLLILLKSFLKKQGYPLVEKTTIEIQDFIDIIEENLFQEIIYDQVKDVQIFIHEKIQEKKGHNRHKELNKKDMKNILSCSRLYFNLQYIKNKKNNILLSIWKRNSEKIKLEYTSPSQMDFSLNNNLIPIWKARNMKLLLDFIPKVAKLYLENIYLINIKKSTEEYKKDIIKYYMETEVNIL